MPYERSAGAIIYFKQNKIILYLLLQYRHLRWDFPRGHVEKGESDFKTAIREIKEETGLTRLEYIPGFKEKGAWFYKKKNMTKASYKEVYHYLARSRYKKVKLSDEDIDFVWLPYKEALALPMFPHVKKMLKKANDFLAKRKKKN